MRGTIHAVTGAVALTIEITPEERKRNTPEQLRALIDLRLQDARPELRALTRCNELQ